MSRRDLEHSGNLWNLDAAAGFLFPTAMWQMFCLLNTSFGNNFLPSHTRRTPHRRVSAWEVVGLSLSSSIYRLALKTWNSLTLQLAWHGQLLPSQT